MIVVVLAIFLYYSVSHNIRMNKDLNKAYETLNQVSDENKKVSNDFKSISDKFKSINNENTTLGNKVKDLEDKLNDKADEINKLKKELETNEMRIRELSKITTFDVNNVGSSSKATPAHLRRALKGTALESLADAFITAEHDTGVNAFFLAALVANESSWGTSDRALSQNNLTGHDVATDYSRGTTFSSKEECIIQTATEIRDNYLNPNGQYYNGVSLSAVNKKYSQIRAGVPNPLWYANISSIANSLVTKANNIPK